MRISQEDVVFLARVFGGYIQDTKEGKKTALRMLGATIKSADIKNLYRPAHNSMADTFNYKDLHEYSGWIYKGIVGLSKDQIEIEANGNMEACEATGIMGPKDYCVQVVKEYGQGGKEYLSSMSNYARSVHTDPAIRDTAKIENCKMCTVSLCEYHPNRESKQLKLLSEPRNRGA